MRDFNFFEGFSKTREKGRKRLVLFASFAALLAFAAFCAGIVLYTFELRLNALSYQIESNKIFLNDHDTLQQINRRDELMGQFADLESYNTKVEYLTERLIGGSLIKTGLILGIADKIPRDTIISTMSVSSGMVNITGVSKSEISIAQFEYNLYELDEVEGVFVSGITTEFADEADKGEEGEAADKICGFSMSIAVKGVPPYVWD